jgi:hypothetical protein
MYDTQLAELRQAVDKSYVASLVNEVIFEHEAIIVKGVRDRWLRGDGVEGGVIGVYKSRDYELFKASLNPLAGGAVDLMLTGKLSQGLGLRKQGNMFQIYSTDSKYKKIGDQYGYEEYGLTREQLEELYDYVTNFVLAQLLRQIWL